MSEHVHIVTILPIIA